MVNVAHLGLSYNCNMKCKHCYVNKKKDKLNKSNYYDIIESLYENGLFILYYTFGEPLCSNLFPEISSYVKSKGIVQVLMTNGSLINEDSINIIKNNGISKVCISIDHINLEIHDSNRNYIGGYDKAISAIKKLIENDIFTGISVAVNSNNVMCLNDIYNLAQELNVKFISFLRNRNDGVLGTIDNEQLYHNFFKTVLSQNPTQTNPLFHDFTLLPILNDLKNNNLINKLTYEKYYEMNCCHNKCTVSIEPSGDVKRCNLTNRIIGNILEEPLQTLLEKEIDINENIIYCSAISK